MSTSFGGGTKNGSNKLQAPAFAQVNLLPPDMRDARRDRMVKRLLLLVLAIVIAVCIGLYLFAVSMHVNASNKLDDANAETAELRREKASLQYVVATYTQLDGAELAEYVAMAPEINWKTYLDGITGTLPEEQSLVKLTLGSNSATTVLTDAHPLMKPRVGTIIFDSYSETVPDIGRWLVALEEVPGFQDASFKTTTIEAYEDSIAYKTETTVEIDASALSKRLEPVDEAEEVDTEEGEN